ncbi:YceI family protein [Ahrensia sp. R2A130]|uniref:YceI family protein n=1 Tax=Ahrensia sp. R2A130 TaxID=744979 RepID=UPI0001E0E908|nr:YceI family protein [Ahrensia sp. R2A130]EFL87471.1 YceI [Ahrensia sp. R2A130]
MTISRIIRTTATTACLFAMAITAPIHAGGHANWTSVDDSSRIAFGSIKSNETGEVHHFNKVSGTVSEAGELRIDIDLSSVETNIDIRNERMGKLVFQEGKATATITGELDMEEMKNLKPGDTSIMEVTGTLKFLGAENDFDAEMIVARLTENRVLVANADFIMVSTEDLGINEGIDTLMKLAKLPGITRVTPVAVRMVFEK